MDTYALLAILLSFSCCHVVIVKSRPVVGVLVYDASTLYSVQCAVYNCICYKPICIKERALIKITEKNKSAKATTKKA